LNDFTLLSGSTLVGSYFILPEGKKNDVLLCLVHIIVEVDILGFPSALDRDDIFFP
jgi:hypothetical protein